MPFSDPKRVLGRLSRDFSAWRRDTNRVMSLAVAVTSCCIAITCASAEGPTPVAPMSKAQPPPPASTAPVVASAAPSASVAVPSVPVAPEPTRLELPHFFADLAALEKKKRDKHVRVLWLGDSHTAADYWSHVVRSPLQKRFGAGGPGLVLVGQKPYRHGAAKVTKSGEWRREPDAPSRSDRQLDGVFGLAGIRAVPLGRDARATITPNPNAIAGKAKFRVLFRAPKAGDKLRAKLDDGAQKDGDQKTRSDELAGSPLQRLTLEGGAGATLELSAVGGAPQIFGVEVESEKPGVIVETLGVNGARAQTPSAWDQTMWEAEAKALAPSLFIYAYGTNDLVSTLTPERYGKHLGILIARGRRVAPESDCLLIGPPDMASAADGKTVPRVVEFDRAARDTAKTLGCGYFSAFDAMGGADSFSRWMAETPALAAKDRVHLSAAGYERVGKLLAEAILDGYARRK
jgi:lysophospholipase L1-like esterase